jgi:hypothetical protein
MWLLMALRANGEGVIDGLAGKGLERACGTMGREENPGQLPAVLPGRPRMWLSMGTDAAFDGHECGF